jgi:hypothetical protein
MRRPRYVGVIALSVVLCSSRAESGDMTVLLDCTANNRLLDTHFGRYGYAPAKSITKEARGVLRFRLPSATKEVSQTGVYSYVVMTGDFEVSAGYEWVAVAAPEGGYGVSCGIAVETGSPGIMVSLARAHLPGKGDKGQGYAVTRGEPQGSETHYETKPFPSKATRGRLVLRRTKDELICLTADNLKDAPKELYRMPFPTGKIHQVRCFADQGGSQTLLDARIGEIKVSAEEITGGFAKSERPRTLPWWLITGGVCLALTIGLWILRRRRSSDE